MQEDRISMSGFAISEQAISELLTYLEGNSYFSMIQPKGTEQSSNVTLGTVTKFSIDFRVGRQEGN
jgi:hypothetical protein